MLHFRTRTLGREAYLVVGLFISIVIGCSDLATTSIHGTSSDFVGPASNIAISPSSASLSEGGRTLFRCAAFDSRGVMLPNPPAWSSSDPTVAQVMSDGSVSPEDSAAPR